MLTRGKASLHLPTADEASGNTMSVDLNSKHKIPALQVEQKGNGFNIPQYS